MESSQRKELSKNDSSPKSAAVQGQQPPRDDCNPRTTIIRRQPQSRDSNHPQTAADQGQQRSEDSCNPKTVPFQRKLPPKENNHPKTAKSKDDNYPERPPSQNSNYPRTAAVQKQQPAKTITTLESNHQKTAAIPKTATPHRQLGQFMVANHHFRNHATVPGTIADESIYQKDTGPSRRTEYADRANRLTEVFLRRSLKRENRFIG
jgi:hypothetical protein